MAGVRAVQAVRGGPFGGRFGFRGAGLDAAASYLGLTDMQLLQQLGAGKSLAEIAAAKGKTVAGLEQAMTAPVKKALDAAVTAKAITSAQETKILSRLSDRLKQQVNQKGLHALASGSAPRPGFRGIPEARDPAKPAVPGNPAKPAVPGNPAKPAVPGNSAKPAVPGNPAHPYGPAFPATPANPSAPSA